MRDVLNFKALLEVGEPLPVAAGATILREISDKEVRDGLLLKCYPQPEKPKQGKQIKLNWEY